MNVFTIVDNDVDFIVVDGSIDVKFSVIGGDFRWNKGSFVTVRDVEENIRSSVLIDKVESDIGRPVGVRDGGSDCQIGLIFVRDVRCKSEITIGVVEGGFEDHRAIFVVDGYVGSHRAIAVFD